MSARGELGVARVLALGAVGQEEVAAGDQAARLQLGAEHVAGRAGIGRALQDDELARPQVAADRPAGGDRRPTGPARGASPSGVGTQIRMASASASREKSAVASNRPAVAQRRDPLRGDVADVALPGLEPLRPWSRRCRSRGPGTRRRTARPAAGRRSRGRSPRPGRSALDRLGEPIGERLINR